MYALTESDRKHYAWVFESLKHDPNGVDSQILKNVLTNSLIIYLYYKKTNKAFTIFKALLPLYQVKYQPLHMTLDLDVETISATEEIIKDEQLYLSIMAYLIPNDANPKE